MFQSVQNLLELTEHILTKQREVKMAKDSIKNFIRILAVLGGLLVASLVYFIQFLSKQ